PVHWPETKLGPWLVERLTNGASVGIDPWLHTVAEVRSLNEVLEKAGISLVPGANLVDTIWDDQPGRPQSPLLIHSIEVAGESSADKRERLANDLKALGRDAVVLTLPDSICWLLNIRGSDIPRNPLAQGFAVLHSTGRVDYFTNTTADEAVIAHLGADVTLHPYDGLPDFLETASGTIQIDPASAPEAIRATLSNRDGVEIAEGADPCVLPKARKTDAEIAATREAHLRDGAAMVEFLRWFDESAPSGGLTEIDAARSLEGFRRATNALHDISFDTISGAGPNAAICHYRVTEGSNRAILPNELYLVDSGGQYIDGTTDITRTVIVGEPSDEHRACFTRVLQGMIAISQARFPRGLAGRDLDALARAPLWRAGLDYDHGTGHGVGVFLSVHEGPQRISRISEVPLEPGMILSNEPGYYREGSFGIRIENLIVVREAAKLGDNRDQLDFETITYAPIDLRLVDTELLSKSEREWLNDYHRAVLEKLGPRVSVEAKDWLKVATRPI
ncbi:MAG: aminopeptidase P family protein, partial [Boseongicola sp.]|nr:aminopeptidase P family protein [Boseongicola sp.]